MKKTLLAAALLAGFAGVAQAETSVTLYGIIDTGLGYNEVKGHPKKVQGFQTAPRWSSGTRFGMINGVQNGSRWGLRGTEDLGDGLQAVFQLESGFDSANGDTDHLFGRQATVGLQSDSWGRLDLGRQTNISSKYFGSIDPFGAGFAQANIGVGLSAANTVRYSNMVMYQTPSFNGFQLGAGYAFNANSEDQEDEFQTNNNTRAITAGLRYDNGPLNIAFSFDQLNAPHDQDAQAKPRMYALGASYDLEVVKLALAYARTTDGWFGGQKLDGVQYADFNGDGKPDQSELGINRFVYGFKANSYMVGLTAPIGGTSQLFGSWQMVDPNSVKLTGGEQNMNVFSLGYTYDLSKRTNLYAYGSYIKDYAFLDGVKATAAGVGVRHRF